MFCAVHYELNKSNLGPKAKPSAALQNFKDASSLKPSLIVFQRPNARHSLLSLFNKDINSLSEWWASLKKKKPPSILSALNCWDHASVMKWNRSEGNLLWHTGKITFKLEIYSARKPWLEDPPPLCLWRVSWEIMLIEYSEQQGLNPVQDATK